MLVMRNRPRSNQRRLGPDKRWLILLGRTHGRNHRAAGYSHRRSTAGIIMMQCNIAALSCFIYNLSRNYPWHENRLIGAEAEWRWVSESRCRHYSAGDERTSLTAKSWFPLRRGGGRSPTPWDQNTLPPSRRVSVKSLK